MLVGSQQVGHTALKFHESPSKQNMVLKVLSICFKSSLKSFTFSTSYQVLHLQYFISSLPQCEQWVLNSPIQNTWDSFYLLIDGLLIYFIAARTLRAGIVFGDVCESVRLSVHTKPRKLIINWYSLVGICPMVNARSDSKLVTFNLEGYYCTFTINFHFGDTSSEYVGHGSVSRSRAQGQGHCREFQFKLLWMLWASSFIFSVKVYL